MEDQDIIRLYNERNEDAIAQTAAKYGDYCYAIAYNVLGIQADAEECVNDTYLRTWNSIPPQKPNSLKLFLARVVRNLALTRYRMAHRQKRGGGEIALALHEIEEFTPMAYDPEDEARRVEFKQCFECFLGTLAKQERVIFLLRYFHTQSTEQIARQTGMKQDTVLRTLSRTRKKLKQHLEKEGFSI